MKRALQVAFLWRKWVMSHIPLNRVSFLLLSIAFMLQKSPWCSFVKIILLNQMWKYHYFFMVIIQNPLEESHFLCVEGNEDDANFKILPAALGGETWRAARRSNTSDKRETEHKTSEHDQIQCFVFWRSPVVCETYEYTNWGAALRSVERLLDVTLNCSEWFLVPGVITPESITTQRCQQHGG